MVPLDDRPQEDCPHGLDPAWCTICKQNAEGRPPAGVRRLVARPSAARRTSSRTTPRGTRPTTTRAPTEATGARTPAQALARLRKVLFHSGALGSWPLIVDRGLRPAAGLAAEADHPGLVRIRDDNLVLGPVPRGPVPSGRVTLRDQRSLVHAHIEDHLDGIGLTEWLALMNERVYLFAKQDELNKLLAKYKSREGQDLLVFDTAKVLSAARGRVEVTTVSPAGPAGFDRCPCRGRDTFVPLADFDGDVADIVDVTVVGGLDHIEDLVTRVIRHHRDREPEVLLPSH